MLSGLLEAGVLLRNTAQETPIKQPRDNNSLLDKHGTSDRSLRTPTTRTKKDPITNSRGHVFQKDLAFASTQKIVQ